MRKFLKNNYKGGIFNPLNTNKLRFEYEVVWQGEVTLVEYEDYDGPRKYPECPVIFKVLGGSCCSNEIYCKLGGYDAEKILRPGELVSAKLSFYLKRNKDGSHKQTIIASDVYTLNDYQEMREAEALYKGSLAGNKQATA